MNVSVEMMMDELRGLSVRQPWAWGICAGVKSTENRTWKTDRRGTIAIHASTSPQVVNAIGKDTGCDAMHRDSFTFGSIIGLADIVEVASYGPQHEDDPFAEGPFCWTMTNGRFLKQPIPLKGKLNLFKISPAIQDQLRSAETFTADLDDGNGRAIADAMTAPPDPVASYLELIDEFWQTNHHEEAVVVAAQRLIELAPDEPSAYVVKAAFRLVDPDATDCSKLLLHALELSGDDELASLYLPKAYLKEKNFREAINAADELIESNPDLWAGFAVRAEAHFALGDFDQSIADWDRTIELAPDDAIYWALRAETKTAKGDRAGASADIAEALRMCSDDPEIVEIQKHILANLQ